MSMIGVVRIGGRGMLVELDMLMLHLVAQPLAFLYKSKFHPDVLLLNLLILPVAVRCALGGAMMLALLVLLFSPVVAILLLLVLLAVVRMRHHAKAKAMLAGALTFVERHTIVVLTVQGLVYALAYNSLLPAGMYFAPDSVNFLRVSNVAPPYFA